LRSLIFVLALLVASFWYWGVHFSITILALSFLIFFHELGHFLAAKYFGVFVKTFSIGFLFKYPLLIAILNVLENI
jgi:regulator of sigma E protease